MKDEKVWDYSKCLIGSPCNTCVKTCTFRLDKDADEKEKENERTIKESKRTVQQDFYRKWRNHLLQHNE